MKNFFASKWMRHLLGIAGMVNIMGGIFFSFFPGFFLYYFYKGLPEVIVTNPTVQSIVTLMFVFILIIGFGNVWSMKDPVRNKLYILIGGLGKLAAVLIWAVSFFNGTGTILLVIASFTDLGLGLLFVLFFIYNRNN